MLLTKTNLKPLLFSRIKKNCFCFRVNKIHILEARRFLCNMQKQRDHPLPDVLVATGTSQIMPLNKLYHLWQLFVTVPPFHHFCFCWLLFRLSYYGCCFKWWSWRGADLWPILAGHLILFIAFQSQLSPLTYTRQWTAQNCRQYKNPIASFFLNCRHLNIYFQPW